ncbi:bifunctional diaminohydroxyphosphoribosylaminopyrimidine deaminase/5-amino-6-(5-phosphoribosylamino)uracil reductase RibD [Spirulina subsalsa FACHB-351]|uniref:Riboflavin biosynthesis protein RibD n=2 Tax=Spirulina subsalsa TaxID=54311 RepID=A0ABT3L6R9_9CYAN|nr:bifunctional diaminohydroxyphosphoribosylaminopyrimidine deaminase/5-amino-6-(5-phosphoribosylamino)uracil reductase RibD [Spirulina subsalsa FACHB-351]
MRRCLQLARKALGKTAPNPLVGCVITQGGKIVGQGFHPKAGEPHAEVFALRAAGEQARGATLYVNLEPCNHQGRTPPCTQAILQGGIRKVVVGMIDPDPRVSGTGVETLQQAGLEVVVGVEEAACRQLNEAFIHRVLYQRPLGILKYAMTLDGKIATTTGHSAWVTGEKARHLVHQQRAIADAVIVGGNTVRQDNPHLTSHGVSERNPLRVIVSPSFNLPPVAHLWDTEKAPTLIFTQEGSNLPLQAQLSQKGVEIEVFDQLTLEAVIESLYERGLSQIFWECGGVLAAQAIQAKAVQKVMAFIAPKIIGGSGAPSPVGDLGFTQMTEALPLKEVVITSLDGDLLVEGYLEG